MKTVLYIKANPKSDEESRTFQLSELFINEYKKQNPQDNVITLNLYEEDIHFLSADDLNKVLGPKNEESKNNKILAYAYQFAQADKYVIAEPLWNLGIPAILKAYFDYINANGITFKYTANGPVGMLENKKALNVIARGGEYHTAPMNAFELGDKYVRTILGFMGVVDYTTLTMDGVDLQDKNADDILEAARQHAIDLAKTF